MNNELHIKIQLHKFNWYGLLKNLRFFDPFLLLYLLENGISYTLIGVLFAIREVIIYVFEIPSGVIADQFGKKTELIICFIFYIISFVLLFIGGNIYIFGLAFIFFGLGEAFRSGTHKAMIIDFMEYHEIIEDKSKIYGKTRSYSLIGSSVSSILSVLLFLVIKKLNILFLIAIVPYVIDMLLILSYPDYLNTKKSHKFTFKELYTGTLGLFVMLYKQRRLRLTLIDSALYNAIFKTLKDYIQYMLVPIITGFIIFESLGEDRNSKMILAIVYAGIYLISSVASRNSYRFKGDYNKTLPIFWLLWAILTIVLLLVTDNIYIVIGFFVMMYILQNIRKPIMVEKIGDCTEKGFRASVLSVESQLTSLFIIVLAPLSGYLFDHYGYEYVFGMVGGISVILFILTSIIKVKIENGSLK